MKTAFIGCAFAVLAHDRRAAIYKSCKWTDLVLIPTASRWMSR
jgi:hypothetical protein